MGPRAGLSAEVEALRRRVAELETENAQLLDSAQRGSNRPMVEVRYRIIRGTVDRVFADMEYKTLDGARATCEYFNARRGHHLDGINRIESYLERGKITWERFDIADMSVPDPPPSS